MSEQNAIEVSFSADDSKLKQGAESAANSVEQNSQRMRDAMERMATQSKASAEHLQQSLASVTGRISNLFASVQGTFLAFTAALAGGGALKGVINASAEWTGEAVKLSKALGITTEQASVLNVALNHLGMDSSAITQANMAMTRQIHSNADAFETLGVQVKDTNGHYRPSIELMTEVNQKLGEIKNTVAQNEAGMQIYGRQWQEIRGLLRLNAEQMEAAEKRARELGLIVGPEGAAMAKAYKEQMRDLNLVGKSLEIQFGNALLPVFQKIGAWMGEEAPAMGKVFAGVLESIAFVAQSVWLTMKNMGDALGAIAAQGAALLRGDLDAFRTIGRMRDEEAAKNEAAYERLKTNFGKGMQSAKSSKPDTGGADYDFGKAGKEKKEKGQKYSEAAWAMEEEAHLRRTYHQIGEERAAFEEASFERAAKAADEWTNDLERANKAVAEDQKKSAAQRTQIELLWATNAAAARLSQVDAAEAAASHEVALGTMTVEELLKLQREFEQQRNDIRRQALQERLATLDPEHDPVAVAQVLAALEELERQHQQKLRALKYQAQIAQNQPGENVFAGMEKSLSVALNGMLTKTQNFRQAMNGLWKSMYQTFLQEMVVKPLAQAAVRVMRESALYKTLFGQQVSQQAAASATVVTTKAGEATAVVGANAAEGASGAAAAVSSIPYVGPIMAVAAFASIMSMIMGAKSNIKSAAGGYDIPSGVNPLTQLHENEMVLPASIAGPLRDSLAGGGGMGGGDITVNIHSAYADAAGIRRLFNDHGSALVESLRRQHRNFATT